MTIDKIKANLDKSTSILRELSVLATGYESANAQEREFLERSSRALIDQLKIIHAAISPMIEEIMIEKAMRVPKAEKRKVERIVTATGPVYLEKGARQQFLEDLGIGAKALKEAKTRISKVKPLEPMVVRPSALAAISGKLFGPMSSGMTKAALFKSVDRDLKKANMPYMLSSYISIILFITFLSLIVSMAIAVLISPSIGILIRNMAIALVVVAIVFFLAVSYPASIVGSNKKKIEVELPFAISHMAAIASSNVEPSKIFSIMALTKEYKAFSAEVRKVVNQINIYGYDLTTALKNVSKTTPSNKVSELFNGISTTIVSGGKLSLYLQEKAKSTLLDYRFARERYSSIIGVYSDVYTALLIAAPLIFMLLLAIMSVLGSTFIGMDIETLSNIGIGAIIVFNIAFIVFLHFTQPEV